jgi:preprotein translocase subunit SecB
LFGVRGIPEEALAPFLLIEAPRLLFPFARQIIADAVTNTGFPPLLLDPIDFTAAYMAQLQAQQGQAGGGEPTPTETPPEA